MKLAAVLSVIACLATIARAQDVQTIPVQGNVYLITGAGGNIAVQIGDQGVLVVDTGMVGASDQVLAAIRKLSPKPIQYILNTHVHADHTGGNDAIRKAGATFTGAHVTGNLVDIANGAQLFAQDNVLQRMSAPSGKQPPVPTADWPTETYISGRKAMSFNNEPVIMIHQPHAHTDGDSLIFFRRSDVLVTGDIFVTTSYPFIDLERGGSIQGEIDALNTILELAIPGRQDEAGTYIIPGHGRICDAPELLKFRDMVTIIRDRIQAAIKKGMSLDQVKAAGLTNDYDARFSAKSGIGTKDMFVEAVYKSLSQKK
jgi:glyoxylase-like metal-dependent hydrolase (beta-lactamase superfamily II)